jgi:hypothetical protein
MVLRWLFFFVRYWPFADINVKSPVLHISICSLGKKEDNSACQYSTFDNTVQGGLQDTRSK